MSWFAKLLNKFFGEGSGGVYFDTDRYNEELREAWQASYDALKSVGAPVRKWSGTVRISWRVCDYKGALGYGSEKNGRYALTIGTVTELCLAPDGSFQRPVAMAEFCHYHLFKNEEKDYPWIRKAALMP